MILIFSTIKSVFNNGFQIAIIFYALLSIGLKLKAIPKLTEFTSYSLLLLFSSVYLLQDFTQIRVAVASGFLLLSIPSIVNRDVMKFAVFVLLAIFFHYSAIIFAPLYFLNSNKINKLLYLLFIVISIFLAITKFTPFDILTKFDLGVYSDRINAYLIGQKWEKREINIFNFSVLIQIMLCIFFIFYSGKIDNKYAIILTKIYTLGIVVFYIFSPAPAIAFRLSDLLNMVQIILIPFIFYFIKPKYVSEIIIILIAAAFFLNQVMINPILHPYKIFLN